MELKNRLKEADDSAKEKEEVSLDEQIIKFKEKTGKNFTEFYKKYLPKLIYYSNKYCKDENQARDFAEEAFIISLEKIDTYDNTKAGFSTWLFTITRNHIFQHLKKKKRIPTVSMDTKIDEEGTTIKEFIPDNSIEDRHFSELHDLNVKKAKIMMDKIEDLKAPYKTVIRMREIEKLSYKQIAARLGEDTSFDIDIDIDGDFKLPEQLSTIYKIVDKDGNEVDFEAKFNDKSSLYSHVKVNKGSYKLSGRKPRNLSTVKSQIRNGRNKLKSMVKEEFGRLDDMYL